jgi:hypothetical protein
MATNTLQIEGLSPDVVYSSLISKGVTPSEATRFIGDWINIVSGTRARSFDYVQAFPETEPDCASNFTRKFAHQDWVDGESVVQAQQSTGESGFNARFHAIEADLDSLGANIAKAFACGAELRKSLFALLAEIKTELNRIDSDLGRLINPPSTPFTGGVVSQGTKFLGTTTLGTQQMTMWQGPQGILLLPGTNTINVDPLNNPRAQRAGQLADFVTQNQAAIAATFGTAAFTKEMFVAKFGAQKTSDGTLVKDTVAIVPDGTSFATGDALVNDVTSREAAALRTTDGAAAAIASALGADAATGTVASAPVEKFSAVPDNAKAALINAGIDTMQKLANANPRDVLAVLNKAGVQNLSAGDVANFTTRAKTLVLLK